MKTHLLYNAIISIKQKLDHCHLIILSCEMNLTTNVNGSSVILIVGEASRAPDHYNSTICVKRCFHFNDAEARALLKSQQCIVKIISCFNYPRLLNSLWKIAGEKNHNTCLVCRHIVRSGVTRNYCVNGGVWSNIMGYNQITLTNIDGHSI